MERGGLVVGPSHAEGGVPFVIEDTGKHVEMEGDEAVIPRELSEDQSEHTFTGTNRSILNQILKKANLSLSDKVTQVKSSDVVICIKSTWSEEKRTYTGTIHQILSAINESEGCKVIEKGATVTPAGEKETKAEGGKISEDAPFKPGTIVVHKAYHRGREINYELVEYLGKEEREVSVRSTSPSHKFIVHSYSAFPVNSNRNAVTGERETIRFTFPLEYDTRMERGWILGREPKPDSDLISKSAIEKEERRSSMSAVEPVFEGKKPVYLMTKDEYKKEVTPLFKAFKKFIDANGQYYKKKDYYGIEYATWDEYFADTIKRYKKESPVLANKEYIEESWTRNGQPSPSVATDSVKKQYGDYIDKFSELFGKENISKIQSDEATSPKRAISRALESDIYEKLILDGKINYATLQKVFFDVKLKIPRKLEKLEGEIKSPGFSERKERMNAFKDSIKERFKSEMEYYWKLYFDADYKELKKYDDFYKSRILTREIPEEHKKSVAHYVFSLYCNFLKKPAKLITNKRGDQYIEYCSEVNWLNSEGTKYFQSRKTNTSSLELYPDYEERAKINATAQTEELFDKLAIAILSQTQSVSLLGGIPHIGYGQLRKSTHRGFIMGLNLVYGNGFSLFVETEMIIAGGYNIQVAHHRYLFKISYNGKRISQEELPIAYKNYKPTEKKRSGGAIDSHIGTDSPFKIGTILSFHTKNNSPVHYKLIEYEGCDFITTEDCLIPCKLYKYKANYLNEFLDKVMDTQVSLKLEVPLPFDEEQGIGWKIIDVPDGDLPTDRNEKREANETSPFFTSLPSSASFDDCHLDRNHTNAIDNASTLGGHTNIGIKHEPIKTFNEGGGIDTNPEREIGKSWKFDSEIDIITMFDVGEEWMAKKHRKEALKKTSKSEKKTLTNIYKEHHESFDDTEKWDLVTKETEKEYTKEILKSWDTELKAHFEEEENIIFPSLIEHDKSLQKKVQKFIDTHDHFRKTLIPDIKRWKDRTSILSFTSALKQHIVDEEAIFKSLMPDPFCPITEEGTLCPVLVSMSNGTEHMFDVQDYLSPDEVRNVVIDKNPNFVSFFYKNSVHLP